MVTEIQELSPTFSERWVMGTYIVSGVFYLDGTDLHSAQIRSDSEELYRVTRQHKKAIWPRGLCGYFIIPIYSAEGFCDETLEFVKQRMRFRWAIWPEPVLYDSEENVMWLRQDYGLFGAAFTPHLSNLVDDAMDIVSEHYGHEDLPSSEYHIV